MNPKLAIFFKGFAMGAANVIPGVSGGTVAFITGIYQRLIDAIKSFDIKLMSLVLRRDFAGAWKHVDANFLLPLLVGVVVSILTIAKVLKFGFESYPILVAALFFGLIAASVYSVVKMVRQWSLATVFALIVGLGLAVSLIFIPEAAENRNFFYLMLCGAVAMCSMIIPGISGSFVLLLLGNYHLIMLDSVNALRNGQWAEVAAIGAPVGIGAIAGLLLLSRVLSWLFRKFHDLAVASVSGFVAGSLLLIWPWKRPLEVLIKDGEEKVLSYERFLPEWNNDLWSAVGVAVLGACIVLTLEWVGSKNNSR